MIGPFAPAPRHRAPGAPVETLCEYEPRHRARTGKCLACVFYAIGRPFRSIAAPGKPVDPTYWRPTCPTCHGEGRVRAFTLTGRAS